MRLLLVNPNTSSDMTKTMPETAVAVAAPGTEIIAVEPHWARNRSSAISRD